jgi:hypothetical protein
MIEIAGWIAPAATMIAAMMTAANLGARVTGWGFVVFTIGAIAWIIVAAASGQNNLLFSNAFLLVVDVIGIWRWLGRQARYEAGAQAAQDLSCATPAPDLFALSRLQGSPILDSGNETIATAVDAMARCDDGAIAYLVVREGGVGGVGERLHAIGWDEVEMGEAGFRARIDAARLTERPALDPKQWPATAEAAGVR